MADENEVETKAMTPDEKEGSASEEKKGGKSMVLMILGVAMLVGGAATYYFGFYNKTPTEKVDGDKQEASKADNAQEAKVKEETDKNASVEGKLLYYNLPEITANLRSKNGFMKVSFILEYYNKANEKVIEEKMPLIVDQLQLFLRDLQKEDLLGTAMLTKLKESILIRINNILAPVRINAILLRDLLVQ